MDTPQIYVACLAAYNNGILHGEWIDATQDAEDIHTEIQKMLKASPIKEAEEWAIHDYSSFGEARLGEYESIDDVAKIARFLADHGELGGSLLSDYSIEDAEKLLEEHYQGSYDSEVDFARYIFDECYPNAIPESLMYYFDYEHFARNLFMCDYFSVEAQGETHVFSCL